VLRSLIENLHAEVIRGPVEYFEKHPGFGFDPPPRRRCFVPVLPGTKQVDTVVVVEVVASEEIVVVTTPPPTVVVVVMMRIADAVSSCSKGRVYTTHTQV
jgi:hypothetical protein